MTYKIEFTEEAEDQLSLIPKGEAKKIVRRVEKLANEPFPPKCEKLKGQEEVYRVRQGDYRILYSVIEKKLVVLVLKIGHRREVYR